MKITICTFGSRGDTQPYLALALGLRQAGHNPIMVVPPDQSEWVRSYGIDVKPLRFNLNAFMQAQDQVNVSKSINIVRTLRNFRSGFKKYLAMVMDDCWLASQESDYLILSSITSIGVDIARQREIPMVVMSLQPLFPPTRAFPMFMLPFRFSLGGRYNYLTHELYMHVGWLFVSSLLNNWRTKSLNLSPWKTMHAFIETLGDDKTPWLYSYSPQVLPKPSDWSEHLHVTGYCILDPQPDWQPTSELEYFLQSGPPPVYIGFGSMSEKNPERLTRIAVRALELIGQRGVLLTGGGVIPTVTSSANILYINDVPHSWLFPQMATVVHHGGAGTTAAGLLAGIPSLISPFQFDQFAWADRVEKLGIGLRLPESQKLTAEKLAQAIQTALTDSALRSRCAEFGKRIREENGVSKAVEVIERHAEIFYRSQI